MHQVSPFSLKVLYTFISNDFWYYTARHINKIITKIYHWNNNTKLEKNTNIWLSNVLLTILGSIAVSFNNILIINHSFKTCRFPNCSNCINLNSDAFYSNFLEILTGISENLQKTIGNVVFLFNSLLSVY